MAKHYQLSPSGASRWLVCPASLGFSSSTSSAYAEEGTAAHDLAERCWVLGVSADSQIGTEINGFVVDGEMAEAVEIYLDQMLNLVSIGFSLTTELTIEHRSIPNFGGTVDCLASDGDIVCIMDYKHGAGVRVEIEENVQLGCYALLALNYFGRVSQDVKLTVVQPRATHSDGPVRSWIAPKSWLLDLEKRIIKASKSGSSNFEAGDHCRWCPGAGECPELFQLSIDVANQDFGSIKADKASEILSKKSAIEAHLRQAETIVQSSLEQGAQMEGWKLVQSLGHRKYSIDENEIVRKCKNLKFGKRAIFESKLLSPAQLEKVVGKELVDSITTRPRGIKVVPRSDKRPAIEIRPVEDDFKGL